MCRVIQLIGQRFIGHETVDNDVPSWCQTLRGSLQALALFVFGEQIEERVVGNEHDTKWAKWHVAHHVPEVCFDQCAVWLCTQLIEHRLRRIDADNLYSACCADLSNRNCESACANTKFEYRTAFGKLQYKLDDVGDVVEVVIPVVIDVGKYVAVLVVRILHTSIPPPTANKPVVTLSGW